MTNAQREAPVKTTRIARLARRAIRQLGIRTPGRVLITFIDARRMRALNRRFLRHDRVTDVLSFRYDGEPTVGEILIVPRQARDGRERRCRGGDDLQAMPHERHIGEGSER